MIKVIEVSSDSNIGGAGKCILTLIENFNRDEFDVSVMLPPNSLLKPEVQKRGVRVIEAEGIAERSLDLPAVGRIKKILKEEKPDIVHTHASMSARIAARLAGTGVVYTRHSVFEPSVRISKGIGKKINGAVNNFFADRIIAVAEAAKDNLTATGVDPAKIDVILNGVDALAPPSDEEKQAARARFGVFDGETVVSIVARLEDIKGHEYFIDAANMLIAERRNIRFFIAGTGSYEETLREKVKKLGLEDRVIFTGFISDVDSLMKITDIQVNASYGTEATSLALLEGMSIGVPAVVSDFGGNPGVIENGVNGFLAQKCSSAALADGLRRILDDEALRRELSEGAKKRFGERFTSARMTRDTEEVYKRVLKEKARKQG